MKKHYTTWITAVILLVSATALAQYTQDFEGLTDGDDSFLLNGITFTSSDPDFDINTFVDAGAGGSDQFMDNLGVAATGAIYSLTSAGQAFTLQSIDMYVSSIPSGDNPTDGQSVEFIGKLGGVTVFTYTKTAGFPTDFSVNEGFFELDFATEPGADYSILNIDELQITLQGTLQYVALDDFIINDEILNADPPFIQTISVVGSPNSTAPSVDFLVDFNEDALNVDVTDFVLDNVGTLGNIASISGSGASYTVTVDNISGEGTISIDLLGANNIEDALGNTPAPAFTAGEEHVVTRCFQETFESFVDGDFSFSSNGVVFNSGATNAFSVEFFAGGGSAGSDQCLSNDDDLGVNKTYILSTTGPELFNVEAIDFYSSSDGGANPTNDGTLTLTGLLGGVPQYTITKSADFPTDFSVNGGWFTIDFATDGMDNYSLENIDALQIQTAGAFTYIGLDNFEHCEASSPADPPVVLSIELVGDPEANVAAVDYTVIFNENANNVSTDDFTLDLAGTATGTINSVSGSGNTYTVNVNGISGEGSLRLDLLTGTDIADDSANSPPDPFTEGERHLVSSCFVETFETLALDANTWVRDGVPFGTSAATFSVDEFIGAGAGGSDRYLDNVDNQGTNQTYSILVTNSSTIFMETMEVFVSSELNGANPTNDGTLTFRGLLDGTEQFSFVKTGSFPTVFGSTNGFSTVDFATDGAADYTLLDVDEIEVTTSGAFTYLGVDNFKFCEDLVAPIAVCQDVNKDLDAEGIAWVSPEEADGGSTDNAARFFLGFARTTADFVTDASSPTDEYFPGEPYHYDSSEFTVPVSGDYFLQSEGNNTSGVGTVAIIYDSEPVNRNNGNVDARPELVAYSIIDDAGNVIQGPLFYNFQAGHIYYMDVLNAQNPPGNFGTFNVGWDMPVYSTQPLKFECSDIGTTTETLYVFDEAGNTDTCTTDITINGRATSWDGVAWDNGAPDLGALASVDGDFSTATDGGNIEACSCIIDNATLTVGPGEYLLTTGDIVIGPAGNLVVENEGSVVQTDETSQNVNIGAISVQKTTPDLALRDFMVIGSPVSTQNTTGFFDPLSVRMFNHTTANFVPNTDVATAFPAAENFADDNGDNWNGYTGMFNAGEGYMFRRKGTDPGSTGIFNLDFNTGTLNSGPISQTAEFNADQNSSPNIISNPYASAIDADLFIAENTAIVSTLYFWEHITGPSAGYPGYAPLNYDMGDISMYTSGSGGVAAANGGVAPTSAISSAQGFGYKAAMAGTVNFTNAMRITGPNNTFRALEPIARDRIWLAVKNETYGLGSQTLIAFVNGATNGVESNFDAKRLATPIALYSELETGDQLGINGREPWTIEDEVQLGFTSMVESNELYSISIADMEQHLISAETGVYLRDNELNKIVNLSEAAYTFTANAGEYSNRFTLLFSERSLDTEQFEDNSIGIYPNPATDLITISTLVNTGIEAVSIYDLRGRLVYSNNFAGTQEASVNIATLEQGVYLVRVNTAVGTTSKQLIKR